MKNYIQPGRSIDCVAPSGGVVAGVPAIIGAMIGIPATTAAQNESFALWLTGVFELPKHNAGSGAELTLGAIVYWDVADGEVNTTATDNTKIGVVAKAATTTALTVWVRLNGAF